MLSWLAGLVIGSAIVNSVKLGDERPALDLDKATCLSTLGYVSPVRAAQSEADDSVMISEIQGSLGSWWGTSW
jgi:hypothetical protein